MNIDESKDSFQKYRGKPWRENQREAVEWILESDKKVTILEASTGAGKSLIAMTAGMAFGSLTYIVHSLILQRQIHDDFNDASKILFGRANYDCLANPAVCCDECSVTKNKQCGYKKTTCRYEFAKREALDAKIKVINTAYYLSECAYVGRFKNASFVVIDEADTLEGNLLGFISLVFTKYALRRLGLQVQADELQKTSKYKDKLLDQWKDFGQQALYRTDGVINKLTNEIENHWEDKNDDQTPRLIKERIRVVRLREKVQLFLDNVAPDWILEDVNDRLSWRPLWLTPQLCNNYLWNNAARFVLLSASFLPVHIEAKRLGLDMDDIAYKVIPSSFPPENRRVIVRPVADLVSKNMDIEVPKVIEGVKDILAKHPSERGLIHGVSYKLSRDVYEGVNDCRLMIHDSSNRQEMLDSFLASQKNAVLISPSMARGLSLDMDKARFQIILKMPYLSLGDRIVQARVYGSPLGQEWFRAEACLSVLQMCGRSVRSNDDFAINYVLDQQFKKVLLQYPRLLPEWFRDAIEFE